MASERAAGMELWLAEYRNAKSGKATEKGLKLLNEFDIFDYVEAKLREAPEVGKRGRDDDDSYLERLNEALILYQHRIETMLETAMDNYPVGAEKLTALPPLPSRDAREREADEDGNVLRG
jgi:hypothetical protein